MSHNIIESTLSIPNKFLTKGILYFGQYGTSGYAIAAKGYLTYFYSKGIPISWYPLRLDKSELSMDCHYNVLIKSLIGNRVLYDTVIFHSTPDLWEDFRNNTKGLDLHGKRIIGYTTWETDRLPSEWVNHINKNVDEVWCPSSYNKDTFENSGVTVPISVIPHIFLKKYNIDPVTIDNDNNFNGYTFYNISELNERKGIEDLINVYCKTFTNKDNVRLILKVHYKDYEFKNIEYCKNVIYNLYNRYSLLNYPKLILINTNISERELLGLHKIGNCYVSLCKSEGFGLTIFDAYNYNKDIIVTGYGGHTDFLGQNYNGYVNFTVGSVKNMEEFSKNYSSDQNWAYPDLEHACKLMRNKYEDFISKLS